MRRRDHGLALSQPAGTTMWCEVLPMQSEARLLKLHAGTQRLEIGAGGPSTPVAGDELVAARRP